MKTTNIVFISLLLVFKLSYAIDNKLLRNKGEANDNNSLIQITESAEDKLENDRFQAFLAKFKNAGNKSNDYVLQKIKEGLGVKKDLKKKRKANRGKGRKKRLGGKLKSKKEEKQKALEAKDSKTETDEEALQKAYLKFREFKKNNGKNYTDDTKNFRRFAKFLKTLAKIDDANADGEKTFTLKINKFSDIPKADFKRKRLNLIDLDLKKVPARVLEASSDLITINSAFNSQLFLQTSSGASLGPEINWVAQGKVNPPLDQGDCGCCWAFSAATVLEGFYAIKKGVSAPLFSRQQLLDCTVSTGFPGSCDGGHPYFATSYALSKLTYDLNSSYSYKGKFGTCQVDVLGTLVNSNRVTEQFFTQVVVGTDVSQQDLYNLLKTGPVALSIDSDADSFVNYESGVLSYTCSSTKPNHAVTLVGYGYDQDSGKNYWRVKNSWGTQWGEKGFFRLEQNPNWNACYIYQKTVSLA